MPIRNYRPTSPGRRNASGQTFEEITKKKPEKRLTVSKKQRAGRATSGRISTRHRGGGAKRLIRIIDFKRDKLGVPGTRRGDRVRPEPQRANRAGLLPGRRQALHPGARRRRCEP